MLRGGSVLHLGAGASLPNGGGRHARLPGEEAGRPRTVLDRGAPGGPTEGVGTAYAAASRRSLSPASPPAASPFQSSTPPHPHAGIHLLDPRFPEMTSR